MKKPFFLNKYRFQHHCAIVAVAQPHKLCEKSVKLELTGSTGAHSGGGVTQTKQRGRTSAVISATLAPESRLQLHSATHSVISRVYSLLLFLLLLSPTLQLLLVPH